MGETRALEPRKRVAREAALLLYTSQEKEYKQAKRRAAKTLGVRVFPSNLEVAEELDKIADEMEGSSRRERLLQMRKEALQIMKALKRFHPRLVGSVWRGTTHRNSDIDIAAFSLYPKTILARLEKEKFGVKRAEWRAVTKGGRAEISFHIFITLPSGNEAEVVVRSPEKKGQLRRCEIYGDLITGLSCPQLQRVLEEHPSQRFLPK